MKIHSKVIYTILIRNQSRCIPSAVQAVLACWNVHICVLKFKMNRQDLEVFNALLLLFYWIDSFQMF